MSAGYMAPNRRRKRDVASHPRYRMASRPAAQMAPYGAPAAMTRRLGLIRAAWHTCCSAVFADRALSWLFAPRRRASGGTRWPQSPPASARLAASLRLPPRAARPSSRTPAIRSMSTRWCLPASPPRCSPARAPGTTASRTSRTPSAGSRRNWPRPAISPGGPAADGVRRDRRHRLPLRGHGADRRGARRDGDRSPRRSASARRPDGKALRFVHKEPYDEIDSTYETITAYLDAKGITVKDAFVEEYVTDLTEPTRPEPRDQHLRAAEISRTHPSVEQRTTSSRRLREASFRGAPGPRCPHGCAGRANVRSHTSPGRIARNRSAGIPAWRAPRRAPRAARRCLVGEAERAPMVAERLRRRRMSEKTRTASSGFMCWGCMNQRGS